MEKKREDIVGDGKNLEWFLRRNFGLKGQYYSDEFEAVIKREMEGDDNALDEWYENEEHEPKDDYTEEAWDAWSRALQMVDDLVAMGLLKDGGMDSPADLIRCGFCDLS